MSSIVIDHLYKEQHALRNIQSTFAASQHKLSTGLQELDIYVPDGTPAENVFRNLGDQIQSLRFTVGPDRDWGPAVPNVRPSPPRLKNLRELTLSDVDITLLYKPLCSIYNPRALTHLNLLRCEGSIQFIYELGAAARVTGLSLQYLAIDLNQNDPPRPGIPIDACLADVFSACGTLKSLHVSWWGDEPPTRISPCILLNKITASGQHLGLLSLFERSDDLISLSLSESELDSICVACPNILQIAYQLPEKVYLDAERSQPYRQFMVQKSTLHSTSWSKL
jgi:hypothetical protein